MQQSRLKALLEYNAETGVLLWKIRPLSDFEDAGQHKRWQKLHAGKEAGCISRTGYRVLRIDGQTRKAHRIIWMMEFGVLPDVIDHINGDPSDNRLSNLRETDTTGNGRNRKQDVRNSSGVTGVIFDRSEQKWRAYVSANGKQVRLGRFLSFDDAVRARKKAEHELGYHPNHGRQVMGATYVQN